ncbi:PPR domain-containing protein/PPR_2 domain-containing protein, partial [Cephalotus follicularis]
SALVGMHAKCSRIPSAQRLFDEMPYRNEVTWHSLISGYLYANSPKIAAYLFVMMLKEGILLTPYSISYALVGCSQLEAGGLGAEVHGLSLKAGFGHNVVVGTCLIYMYTKCRNVEDSRRVFDEMVDKNVITYTSMVTAYAQNGQPDEAMILVKEIKVCSGITIWDQISWNAVIAAFSNLGCGEEALDCFIRMRLAGIYMDFFTFASVLGAIGIISALEEGKQIHALVLKNGHISNICIQNGIVSMYARGGAIRESKKVFSTMDEHDVISWNSLLSGCAHHGYGEEAIELFEQMTETGIKPNSTTFLTVLSACSHVGLVDKGLKYFNLMRNNALLEPPRAEHYASVVDLFGRAGYLTEAEAFISSMPIQPGPSVYKALLSACQVHGNREIAARAAKKLLQLWPNDPGTYILLSNVLRTGGSWDNATGLRNLMSHRGVRKNPGYSWI